jgi:hypothetical protein
VAEVYVPVQWIEQETLFYCGPAVAEMILRAHGAGPPSPPPTWQDRLWEDVQDSTGAVRPKNAGPGTATSPPFPTQKCEKCPSDPTWHCWSTTPDALVKVLNMHQGLVRYAATGYSGEKAATASVLDALDAGLPSAVLVFGWQHWVVVRGYIHDDPGACDVPGRVLDGVFIRDPQVNAPMQYVTCDKWHDDYLRVVPCGDHENTYVVVIGRHHGHSGGAPPSAPTNLRILGMAEDPASAAARAATELLRQSPRWRAALENAVPGRPLKVQRLDLDDEYYYIVPFARDGRITARLMIDERHGEFVEATGIEAVGESLPPYINLTKRLEEAYGRAFELPHVQKRVLRPGTVGVHPVLVWKPSAESPSPWLPFYQLSVGDQFVYLRVDGRLVDRLRLTPV